MRRLVLLHSSSGGRAATAAVLASPPCSRALGGGDTAPSRAMPVSALHRARWGTSPCFTAAATHSTLRLLSTSATRRKPMSPSSTGGGSGSAGGGGGSGKDAKKASRSTADAGAATLSITSAGAAAAAAAAAEHTGGAVEEPLTPLATEAAAAAAVSLARSQLRRWRPKKTLTSPPRESAATAAVGTKSPARRRSPRRSAAKSSGKVAPDSEGLRGGVEGSREPAVVMDARMDGTATTEDVRSAADSNPSPRAVPLAVTGEAAVSDAVSPFYFTERCATRGRPPTEAEMVAERASITKLFVISDSVASIFSALPHDEGSIQDYLNEVDRAVLPTAATAAAADPDDGRGEDGSDDGTARGESYAMHDIAQRVLIEASADHSLCIHVRDMEQLVPPPLLARPPTPTPPAATGTAALSPARRGRGRRPARKAAAVDEPRAPTPTETAGEALGRVKALQEWQTYALQRARDSQTRWALPDTAHAITRVRMHEPHKADLTVVQGSGGPKTVEDVLAALRHKLGAGWGGHTNTEVDRGGAAVDDDDDYARAARDLDKLNAMGIVAARSVGADAPFPSFTAASRASQRRPGTAQATLSYPFALKPLLTVIATCLPRRESQLGARHDEARFLARGDYSEALTTEQTDDASPGSDAAAATAAAVGSSPATPTGSTHARLTDDEVYAIIRSRGVPTMPRYNTRITLLIEHDALEPTDLLSLAEISTARKDPSASRGRGRGGREPNAEAVPASASAKPKRRKTHVYCLVVDGGEF